MVRHGISGVVTLAILLLFVGCSALRSGSVDGHYRGDVGQNAQLPILLGLRSGMTRAEAKRALTAQRFAEDRNGVFWRASADSQEFVTPRYVGAQHLLFSLSYRRTWSRRYFEANLRSEASRRRELRALVSGEPISWERDRTWEGDLIQPFVVDRFLYATSRVQGIRQREERVQACFAAWGCVSVRDNVDCRPIVEQNRSPIIEGEFRWPSELSVEFTDYDLLANDLLSNEQFATRDLTEQACLVPYIHD